MGRRLPSLHAVTEKTGTVLSIRQYPNDLPKEMFDFAYDVHDPPIYRHIEHFSMVAQQVPLRGTNNTVKNESRGSRRGHQVDKSHSMHWDTPRHTSGGDHTATAVTTIMIQAPLNIPAESPAPSSLPGAGVMSVIST